MVRTFSRGLLTCSLAAAVFAATASAQAPTRSGFFIGFGVGAGSFGVEDADERETAPAAIFRIGGALSDRVLLAGESAAWFREEGNTTVTSSSLSAVASVYPDPTGGFFLQGGLGIANLEVEAGGLSASDTGTAFTLGLGYDIGFGGRFGLTPYGNLVLSNFDGGSTSLFHFGLGFNWY